MLDLKSALYAYLTKCISFYKQCRSRSAGFIRSQLIRIYIVCLFYLRDESTEQARQKLKKSVCYNYNMCTLELNMVFK